MDFLSQTYIALRGPTGAPQTAIDTIGRLSDRLTQATLISDRRAAVLALKGLARQYKEDVGELALNPLLDILSNDAKVDEEIGKAVLETLTILCDVDNDLPGPKLKHERELALRHVDAILANPKALNTLFSLLGEPIFYARFGSLKLLSTLLQHRKAIVQDRIIQAQAIDSLLIVLDEKNDIIRNEALVMLQSLIVQHFELQKVLAFGGVFEKLFAIIRQEQGIDGGILVQDCLTCIDGILRFNTPAQSYFREISMLPQLLPFLLFPPTITPNDGTPQEFSLQFWDAQKVTNAGLVIGILSLLVSATASNLKPLERYTVLRCLSEMALSSNAPTILKTQALRSLPLPSSILTSSPSAPSDLKVNPLFNYLTPHIPVPDTNGEEWDRLEPVRGVDSLVSTILEGEYNGTPGSWASHMSQEAIELRGAALAAFDEFVRDDAARTPILTAMGSSSDPPQSASRLLIGALSTLPTDPLFPAVATRIHLSTLLMASLLRSPHYTQNSPKAIARSLTTSQISQSAIDAAFFVPADSTTPDAPTPRAEDDESPSTLLQLITEHLTLSSLARSHASSQADQSYNADSSPYSEWDKVIVGYVALLSTWLWKDPPSVRVFLEGGGVGVLVDLVNQESGVDILVQGLCSFLLGICYEFNREPGEINRETLYPIINRLGVDTIASRMNRLREDSRFKGVTPESIVIGSSSSDTANIWLDWGFVDFWKSNYHTIQRGLYNPPDAISPGTDENAEMSIMIASLRDVVRKQAAEYDKLQNEFNEFAKEREFERESFHNQISILSQELDGVREQKKDVEKEQEDLLVLLEEVSSKRRRDKQKMREQGIEVSDEEAEEDDGEGDD